MIFMFILLCIVGAVVSSNVIWLIPAFALVLLVLWARAESMPRHYKKKRP